MSAELLIKPRLQSSKNVGRSGHFALQHLEVISFGIKRFNEPSQVWHENYRRPLGASIWRVSAWFSAASTQTMPSRTYLKLELSSRMVQRLRFSGYGLLENVHKRPLPRPSMSSTCRHDTFSKLDRVV